MSDHIGETIRRARVEAGLSLADLARRVYVTKGALSMIENGKRRASASVLAAIADALGVDLRISDTPTYPWDPPASSNVALVFDRSPDGSVIIVSMDRRGFLATATAGAAAIVLPVSLPDRLTPDTLTALTHRLDWHIATGHNAHPTVVARAVQADLERITAAARSAPATLRPATLSLAARYAEYLGWMRQEAGDTPGSLYWTDRAGDLAHAAGWRHMVAYSIARKAGVLEHEDPSHAGDLARAARTGPWRLSPGMTATAAAKEAEAYARAGDDVAARRAEDVVHRALARMDIDDEPPIGPSMLRVPGLPGRVWSARIDLLLGRHTEGIAALSAIVAVSPRTRGRAIDGARLATAYATVGDVDEACRVGLAAARYGTKSSATAARELGALRPALEPWAGRSDVDQLLAELPV